MSGSLKKLLNQGNGSRAVVVGTGFIALDVVVGPDGDLALPALAGGTCGNVLSILAWLGWDSFPVARFGNDVASQVVANDMAASGVHLDFAFQSPGCETPVVVETIRRDRKGEPRHRFSITCPHCGAWFPSYRSVTAISAEAVADAISDCAPATFTPAVFFFDRVSAGSLLLARRLREQGTLVVFEPAGIGDPKLFAQAIAITDILKYSNERLPQLAARQPAGHQLLLEIETHGKEGLKFRSRMSRSNEWRHLGAIPIPKVVDAAGAGDWFTAGLLFALAGKGRKSFAARSASSLLTAMRYAQALAAIACSFAGARGAMYEMQPTELHAAARCLLQNDAGDASEVVKVKRHGFRARTDISPWVCQVCPG